MEWEQANGLFKSTAFPLTTVFYTWRFWGRQLTVLLASCVMLYHSLHRESIYEQWGMSTFNHCLLFDLDRIAMSFIFTCHDPIPEWIPMRIQTGRPGRCRNSKDPMKLRISSAIIEMSTAWRLPFLFGKPLTTMYASPMVSTCGNTINSYHSCLLEDAYKLQMEMAC